MQTQGQDELPPGSPVVGLWVWFRAAHRSRDGAEVYGAPIAARAIGPWRVHPHITTVTDPVTGLQIVATIPGQWAVSHAAGRHVVGGSGVTFAVAESAARYLCEVVPWVSADPVCLAHPDASSAAREAVSALIQRLRIPVGPAFAADERGHVAVDHRARLSPELAAGIDRARSRT